MSDESNTALLKNDHSHDHCLLSKWRHVTCSETPLHASMQNDKSRVEKRFYPFWCRRCYWSWPL